MSIVILRPEKSGSPTAKGAIRLDDRKPFMEIGKGNLCQKYAHLVYLANYHKRFFCSFSLVGKHCDWINCVRREGLLPKSYGDIHGKSRQYGGSIPTLPIRLRE